MALAFVSQVGVLSGQELPPALPPSESAALTSNVTDETLTMAATDRAESSASPLEVEPALLNTDQYFGDENIPLPVQSDAMIDPASVEVSGAETQRSSFRMVATVYLQSTYDDNIFISPSGEQSDLMSNIAPTIALGLGDVRSEFKRVSLATFSPALVDELYEPRTFLFFRYTPTATIFLDHGDENVLNHDVAFEVRWKQAYLTLGSRSTFQTLSDATLDVGSRVDRAIFSQSLTIFYDYSDRTSFEFNLLGAIRNYSGALLDSQELESQNWIDYRVGARTHVGLGLAAGYLGVSGEENQFYQQILIRTQYSVTDKISLAANGGVERREFGNGNSRLDPVFGASITYQPFEQTMIILAGFRSVENSAGVAGQDIVSTDVNIDIRQRFFRRFYLCFKGDYLNAEYVETGTSSTFSRTDQVRSLTPYVRMDLPKGAAIMAGFTSRRNVSTAEDFRFTQNQAFIEMNFLF